MEVLQRPAGCMPHGTAVMWSRLAPARTRLGVRLWWSPCGQAEYALGHRRLQVGKSGRCALERAACQKRGIDINAVNEQQVPWTSDAAKPSPEIQDSLLKVVLVSPQIPGNAGSTARTCAAAGVGLHLVAPMAFQIDDTKLKRAGLDYWPYVCVKVHPSWNAFMEYFREQEGPKRLIGYSKKASEVYTRFTYQPGDWLLFGSEVDGLPPEAIEECLGGQFAGGTARIPMNEKHVRSLNLSVSVGIGLYEAIRQLDAKSSLGSGTALSEVQRHVNVES